MVSTGEVTTDGTGRYRLAGHLVDRQARQSRSRSGVTLDSDGSWVVLVVVVTGSTAEVRSKRRRALAYARLAELREGVWLRPANVEVTLAGGLERDLERMTARPADPRHLAARLWDLEDWSVGAQGLVDALAGLSPDGPAALAPGFELSAAVLRHLQSDPLLPAEMLPPEWPGAQLRAVYDEWDQRYRETLRAWSRQT